MKKLLIIVVITALLSGCFIKGEKKDHIYHIIDHLKSTSPSIPPPPPCFFYGTYNFILLDTSLYFYKKHIPWRCMVSDPLEPPRILLLKDDLFEIGSDSLFKFLTRNVYRIKEDGKLAYTVISIPTDTIRNKNYNIIKALFRQKKDFTYHP